MVDVAMREHAVNDSATPQSETMQMTYHVTRCIEAIYGTISKKDMAQATVQVYCLWYCKVYHVDSSIFKLSGRKSTTELSSNVAM